MLCLIPILLIIFALVIPIYMYKDAEKRGYDSPVLWALVGLFAPLIGLIVWLVVREDKTVGE